MNLLKLFLHYKQWLPAAGREISPRSSLEVMCGWGNLNSFSARGGGDLNKNFPKIQMPGGLPGGMLKLRFDWYIRPVPIVLGNVWATFGVWSSQLFVVLATSSKFCPSRQFLKKRYFRTHIKHENSNYFMCRCILPLRYFLSEFYLDLTYVTLLTRPP